MNAIDRAHESWGDSLPDWVRVLAEACTTRSQAAVASTLGYSATVINQVIGHKYPGDIDQFRQTVEGALMGHLVQCPELGDMRADVCLRHQSAKFSATNHLRVRLFKACRNGCPHSRIRGHNNG